MSCRFIYDMSSLEIQLCAVSALNADIYQVIYMIIASYENIKL